MSGSRIRLYGSTSGYVELEAPAVGDDGVLTLPTAADGFGAAGIGSNVVQTTKSDVFTTTSTSFVAVTDFDVTITPTSATSKVLVLVDYNVGLSTNSQVRTELLRDATILNTNILEFDFFGSERNRNRPFHTIVYLDSPATTSAVTYSLKIRATGGTAYFNRDAQNVPALPTFTAIEVAA